MAAKGQTKTSPDHAYKLYYFNMRGAAEALRLVFAVAGVEYEDVRYTFGEEWQQHKEEMPQKMMPCLEIDGKKHCQSGALLRFLGRQYNLYGKTNLEALVIDEIAESFVDMTKGLGVFFSETNKDKKAEGMKKIVDETFPKYVPLMCKRLKENGTGFLVGDSLTIGDLILYRNMDFLRDFIGGSVEGYDTYLGNAELLKKHFEMVGNTPAIKAWIAKRPASTM